MRRILIVILLLVGCQPARNNSSSPKIAESSPYFAIEVVDAATGRGVPMVELRSTNDIRHYTDSNGLVAFNEPGLMGRNVFFYVSSPGYDFPADGFGSRGRILDVVARGATRLEINRINIAERLYRVTGQGIYADSVLLGRETPLKHPTLSGGVMGQDSVYAILYNNRIHWFFGDTVRPNYPLGNFHMSGAISDLPGKGGLDPARGIDLEYFTDKYGLSRGMAPSDKPGVVWIDGLPVVRDTARERLRMIGSYERLKQLGQTLERGLVAYDDESDTFKFMREVEKSSRILPRGHSFHVKHGTTGTIYFAHPYPLLRVANHWDHAMNPAAYEAFTCLKAGTRFDPKKPQLDRDANGKLMYAWKRNTDPVGPTEQEKLIKSGAINADEAWIDLRDIETDDPIQAHNGTVAWNDFRNRYIMIFTQARARESMLGEVWYSEADRPEGPWRFARKVASHPDYSFYNPCHHPFFDQDGGRTIYFQGTYTAEFSRAKFKTPRYDYNQLMYRLDLSDPRLKLDQRN
jgi:hypothetical protein